jgi:uncharacterized protein YceK
MQRGEDMIKHKLNIFLFVMMFVMLNGCATVPTGPRVMVLPGPGKPFDQFQAEDATCRQWARQQIGQSLPEWEAQRRYDIAYQQCMYANGNVIPGTRRVQRTLPPPPPPSSGMDSIPSDSSQPYLAPAPPPPPSYLAPAPPSPSPQ